MGAVISLGALVLHFGFGFDGAAQVLLGLMVVAATLESGFAICIGCIVFGWLMRIGLIPAAACEACNNLSRRIAQPA
jgi:hypothetical protein